MLRPWNVVFANHFDIVIRPLMVVSANRYNVVIRPLIIESANHSGVVIRPLVIESANHYDIVIRPLTIASTNHSDVVIQPLMVVSANHYDVVIRPLVVEPANLSSVVIRPLVIKSANRYDIVIRPLMIASANHSDVFIRPLIVISATPWNAASGNPCNSAWAWYQEGLALYDNSRREAYYYRKAIEVCPEFVEAYNSLGRVYLNQGEYDLSIQAYKQAWIQSLSSDLFSSRPGSSDLFIEPIINLGRIYRMQGKYTLAAAEFKRALEINPNSTAAQNNIQYIYKRLHNYDFVLSPRHKMLTNGIFARIPGTTLPKGGIALAMHYRNWQQTSKLTVDMFDNEDVWLLDASPSDLITRIQSGVMGLRYGLSNNFTIGLMALYFARDVEFQLGDSGMQMVNANPKVKGMGDLQFLIKYHLWGHKRNHLSLYNLLTIPTGKEKLAVAEEYIWTFGEFAKVTRNIPLGSGSYDFTPGISLTNFYDPVIFQSNIQYRITDGELVGDELAVNFGAIYPLNNAVNVLLETGYRLRGDVKREQTMYALLLRPDFVGPMWLPAGPEEITSTFTSKGGHSLYIAPGLQFMLARSLKLELGIKFPVLKQAEGWREDIVFHAGLVMMKF